MAKNFKAEFVDAVYQMGERLKGVGNVPPQDKEGITYVPIPRQRGTGSSLMDDLLRTGLHDAEHEVEGAVMLGSPDKLVWLDLLEKGTTKKETQISKWTGKSYEQKGIKSKDLSWNADSNSWMDGHILHDFPIRTGTIFLSATDQDGSLNNVNGKAKIGAVYTLDPDGYFGFWGAAGSASTFYPKLGTANCEAFSEKKPFYNANFMFRASNTHKSDRVPIDQRLQHGEPARIEANTGRISVFMVIPADPDCGQKEKVTAELQIPWRLRVSDVLSRIEQEQDPIPELLAHIRRERIKSP